MMKTLRMQLIEAQRRASMDEVLIGLYAQHWHLQSVAEALGVTRQTLNRWMKSIDMTALDLRTAARERGNGQNARHPAQKGTGGNGEGAA